MFGPSAPLYDAIYHFKDYDSEAQALVDLAGRHCPEARTMLDVACGTHEHVRVLKARYAVDGLDLMPAFLDAARLKNPDGRYVEGDMRDFDMGARYDLVVCLFSSVGYLLTAADLHQAVGAMARHLAPGGLLCIEPWIAREDWKPGRVVMHTADEPERKIVRISRSGLDGDFSLIDFFYLVAVPDEVSTFEESHRMRLHSDAEMRAAFEACGQPVSLLPDWPGKRGLYINR